MSNNKRPNINGQMKREDYEAMDSRRGGDGDGLSEGFAKADESVMARRKIRSAKRPTKPKDDDADGDEKTGAFSNFSFTKPSSSSSTNTTPVATNSFLGFGAATATPAAAPAQTPFIFGSNNNTPATTTTAPTPGFSFGNFSTTTAPTAGGTPGFSFAGSTAPSPFVFGGSSTTTTPAVAAPAFGTTTSGGPSELSQKYQRAAIELEKKFLERVASIHNPVHADLFNLVSAYLDGVFCLETEYWEKEDSVEEDNGAPSIFSSPQPFFSTMKAAPSPAAPAPVSPPPVGLFGAGATTTTTPASTTLPTPAGTFAANDDNDDNPATLSGDTPAMANEPSTVIEGDADKDWITLDVVVGTVAYYEGAEIKKKATGVGLKAQEHKDKKTNRRLVMREGTTGKVLVNLTIPQEVSFIAQRQTTNNKTFEWIRFLAQLEADGPNVTVCFKRQLPSDKGVPLLEDLFPKWGMFKNTI